MKERGKNPKVLLLEGLGECIRLELREYRNSPAYRTDGEVAKLKINQLDAILEAIEHATRNFSQYDTLCKAEVKDISEPAGEPV